MGRVSDLARTSAEHRMPRILVNSLPKSGTHLLASVLDLIPGLSFQKPVLNRRLRWHPVNCVRPWDREMCLLGVGQPRKVRLWTLRYMLNRLSDGCYMIGHIPYQESVNELLQTLGIRTFFVIRDPRDVVVSQVHHYLRHKSHYLHRDYKKLRTDKERWITAILGIRKGNGNFKVYGIAEKLDIVLGWTEAKSVLTLRFEDLIGERGGGELEVQKESIMKIGNHLGMRIGMDEAIFIGNKAFGKGDTYRRGEIGSWRDVFDDEVRDVFKREAGEHLIEMGYETNYDW